jgi:murein DD-endopeptidase / murein LD-carboxypeptidase
VNKSLVFISVIAIGALFTSCSGTKYAAASHGNTSALKTRQPDISNPSSYNTPQLLATNNTTTSPIQNKYAQLLDIDPRFVNNLKLYQFIDDWYHAPYKYAGRSKSGVDCSDFVSLLLDSVYTISFGGSSASMFTRLKPVKKEDLHEGDLVFFKIAGDRISHVGFYLTNNKFVHASVSQGITISDLNEDYYKKYFYSGGRFILN